MKKRVFAVFACMLLVLSAGCGKKDPAPETPDTDPPKTVVEAATEPLTEDEILDLYASASKIYGDISMMVFPTDEEHSIIVDDITYYRLEDDRFENYEELKAYLNQFFTINMVNTELLKGHKFVEGKDGYLYVADAARGSNDFYAGYVMGEPIISDDEIKLPLTAYYTADDEPYTGEGFCTEPDNPEDFRTEEYEFTLLPEDGVWKFEIFRVFY